MYVVMVVMYAAGVRGRINVLLSVCNVVFLYYF
jgi:hypothetical protein